MSWNDPEYVDDYYEQMLCDGSTEESLEDAGYSCGYDLLDDQDTPDVFDSDYDDSGW